MTATASEHSLLIGGEQVETGEWLEVESPFSGEVIGRVAKGGAEEARRALDAAAAALAAPLPAYERATSSTVSRICSRSGARSSRRRSRPRRESR